jgi:hypothetical protein
MLENIFFLENYMDCHNVSNITCISGIFMPSLWGHDKSICNAKLLEESLIASLLICTIHFKYLKAISPHYTVYKEEVFLNVFSPSNNF